MMQRSNILIVAEHKDGKISPFTRTLIYEGRTLADKLQGELYALVLGEKLDIIISQLDELGIDVIVTVTDSSMAYPESDFILKIMQKVVKDIPFRAILLGHSYLGIEIGSVLSSTLQSSFISNCSEIAMTETNGWCIRPLYEGLANIKLNLVDNQIAVISLRLIPLRKAPNKRHCNTRSLEYTIEECGIDTSLLARILEIIEPKSDGLDLTKSHILIGVGRGITSQDNLKIVFDLAASLGGAVACSRPLIDLGWLPSQHLVGLSGSTVTPKVYLALGISGSAQHLAGMSDSEIIIAIK